ncbi:MULTISPECIES: TIGR01777 family oxidoreductase [unclassified Shewanella]|uniref:TIGR01777 family oxidoreductase n=1 Tax=Shewanella TaxID=22 RepID=UPI001C5AC181|nr:MULTISPECIES: TIGR01777 family oxidoreductase [unclassified Shewanella]MBW3532032.1 TIGR01777 family oxidoreductase [Shewanella sp. NKUCC06_TVS]MCU7985908.1 TIGR01777 family oxidoreductase [Shewanella sp. SW24]MCU8031445.1 TIGR01777 family oxidoreductase [Shewanella sp. SM73]
MNILITGASGFIGRQLVERLAPYHQLTLLTRSVQQTQKVLGSQHHYLESLDALSDLNHIDAIVNLAGEPIVAKRWSKNQKQRICDSRWNITARLTQLIQQSSTPPQIMVSGSAVGYYGRHDDKLLDESSGAHVEFSHDICRKWEQEALNATSEHTRVCIIRIGIVLGKGGALEKMLPPFKLGLGGPIGHGRQGMSWIHVQDLISLIDFLLTQQHCKGIFNATAPNPVSNAVFTKALGKALNRPALITTPPLALRLAMGEMSELLTEGQFVYPKRALEAGFQFQFSDLDNALTNVLAK